MVQLVWTITNQSFALNIYICCGILHVRGGSTDLNHDKSITCIAYIHLIYTEVWGGSTGLNHYKSIICIKHIHLLWYITCSRWFDWFEPWQINHLYCIHTFNMVYAEGSRWFNWFKPLQINHLYWIYTFYVVYTQVQGGSTGSNHGKSITCIAYIHLIYTQVQGGSTGLNYYKINHLYWEYTFNVVYTEVLGGLTGLNHYKSIICIEYIHLM